MATPTDGPSPGPPLPAAVEAKGSVADGDLAAIAGRDDAVSRARELLGPSLAPEGDAMIAGQDGEARLDQIAFERLLHDRDIGEVANALVDEVLALSARAKALKRALKRPRFAVNLCRVWGESSSAGVTATVALRLEASDLATQLLTAVRAANRDLHAVDLALDRHGLRSPSVGEASPESPDPGSQP